MHERISGTSGKKGAACNPKRAHEGLFHFSRTAERKGERFREEKISRQEGKRVPKEQQHIIQDSMRPVKKNQPRGGYLKVLRGKRIRPEIT